MTEGHTATWEMDDSEWASVNGLAFVWYAFKNGAALDYYRNVTILPAGEIDRTAGIGACFTLSDPDGHVACKYLYVSKDRATGNKVNSTGDAQFFVLKRIVAI